jgi:hypothetical protein
MMRNCGKALIVITLLGWSMACGSEIPSSSEKLQPFIDCLATRGSDPVDFVLNSLLEHDLLIFDDAAHTSVEPFDFYEQLVRTPAFARQVEYIFVELASVSEQPDLDKYFATSPADPSLLYPVFQNISDRGLPYETYFNLMQTIHETNASLPDSVRYQVIGVSHPTRWPLIETKEDLEIAQRVYLYRDNLMYGFIRDELSNFEAGKKGIFLTNTRHAYTGIKRGDGSYYWNTATYFSQWHPGKTQSIRFHNASLHISAKNPEASGDGGRVYRWVRMGDGVWDSAFAARGDQPVAFPLAGTPFGNHPYIGNHMLNVEPGLTMADAYDAIIFLAPLESQRETGRLGGLFTPAFRRELVRRYRIKYTPEQLAEMVAEEGADSVAQYIDLLAEPRPARPLAQAARIGPVDAWR